jgi:GntR family transcriptional repressor for pyruvate dehydrogenase complex
MPFQSIEPRRLYRQIADQIRGLIRSGEFSAGARLPPERDLAKQLGVSRPSVREALIALEVEGLVEVRIGSGIYVLAPGGVGDLDAANDSASGPFELLRARYVIESECAALAAKSAKKSQVTAIEVALDEM